MADAQTLSPRPRILLSLETVLFSPPSDIRITTAQSACVPQSLGYFLSFPFVRRVGLYMNYWHLLVIQGTVLGLLRSLRQFYCY